MLNILPQEREDKQNTGGRSAGHSATATTTASQKRWGEGIWTTENSRKQLTVLCHE